MQEVEEVVFGSRTPQVLVVLVVVEMVVLVVVEMEILELTL
jgi:hypothetical protein